MKRFIKIFTVLALLTCTFAVPVDAAAADYRYSRKRRQPICLACRKLS